MGRFQSSNAEDLQASVFDELMDAVNETGLFISPNLSAG